MSNDFPRKRKFTSVIDLTTRGQEVAKAEVTQRELQAAAGDAPADSDAPEVEFALTDAPEIVQRAAANAGWERFMPVQEKTIPGMLAGRDLIVQSKTGSGKTGAFLLPLFASLDASVGAPQALVMTPTRELARQIHEEFLRFGGPALGFRAALVYGGVAYGPQQDALRGSSKEGPAHLVIGTPGRILDHLERRTFSLDRLRTLVLDEADEMLSMGFLPAMRKLHRYLPDRRQSAMFSATMPPAVRSLANQFLDKPQFLALAGGTVQIDALSHRYYVLDAMEKDRALIRLIEMENPESAIIFANTKREVEYLAQFLRNYGHDAGEISGDLNQSARESMMARIRAGNLRFLIATDVAARGIDISDLTHVVQYDVPIDPEYYVHRAGRTARAGKTGVAITLAAAHEKAKLLGIFRRYDLTFEERALPTDEEVAERVRERLTVLLEDRYRETKNITRERIGRFEPLAKALAEEEPHLLALLLDGLYHESLHRAPQAEVIETSTHRGLQQLPREERSRGRSKGRRGENDDLYAPTAEPSGDAETDDTPAPLAQEAPPAARRAPAPPRAPAPEAFAAEGADEEEGDEADGDEMEDAPASESSGDGTAPSEGGRRRKKRRRKKRKGDAPPLQPETGTAQNEATEASEPTETPAADAVETVPAPTTDPDASERRRGRGRGGRGRGDRAPEAPLETTSEPVRTERAAPESTAPDDAPSAEAAPRPERSPRAEAPTEPQRPERTRTPESAPGAAPAGASKRAAVPPGPYRIQGLRALPEGTLRAVGEAMEIAESTTAHREDLVYRILEVQAERESTGRGRRAGARPGKPTPGRAAPAARTPEPARPPAAPKAEPAATVTPAPKPDAAEQPERARRGRGRRQAEPASRGAEVAVAETSEETVSAVQSAEPTPEAAPTRSRRGRKAAPPETPEAAPATSSPSPEAPAAASETAVTETAAPEKAPRRRTRKPDAPEATGSTPVAETLPAPEAEKPRRRRKADAPPLEPIAAAEAPAPAEATSAPKPRTRRKAAAETGSGEQAPEAPSVAAPPSETTATPKPRAPRRKKQDEG